MIAKIQAFEVKIEERRIAGIEKCSVKGVLNVI
jgi:hypothetical protein